MAPGATRAILVAHASGSWLDETLASLAGQTHPVPVTIAAVGDVRVAPPEGLDVEVVGVAPGTGFAAAVTEALKASSAGTEPLVLLLHDDVRLEPDAVERMVERAEADEDIAAVGAKLLEWRDDEILQEVGGSIDRFARRRRGVEADEIDHGQYDDMSDVVFSSAACLLVRRDALERHGLDPDSWPQYEDVDLCWRLRASGARVVVATGAKARHVAAMSRGMRRAAGPRFGVVALAAASEHGRLRFMLKNYEPLGLVLLLPQYLLLELVGGLGALLRRDFWRIRSLVQAWGRVLRELPGILETRRSASDRVVDDHEILALAGRHAASVRRLDRVAVFGAASEAWRRVETNAARLVREPVAWISVAAITVVAVTLRDVLFGGTFTLGELRPFPSFSPAWSEYVADTRLEGLDVAAPAGPAILILGLLRSLPALSAASTQKLALLGPLVLAYLGVLRMGRVLGLRNGRYWLAALGVANPVTLSLLRNGDAGGLVLFASAAFVSARFLVPHRGIPVRGAAIWCLGWAVVVALHPPSLLFFVALGAAVAVGRAGDGRLRHRVQDLGLGVAGAFLLGLPWSLEWFRSSSPLVGRAGGHLESASGLDAATFGVSWPLLLALGILLAVVTAIRTARLALTVSSALAVSFALGAAGVFSETTALAAVAFCAVFLGGYAARTMQEDVRQYALGWRQVGVLLVGVGAAVTWVGGAVVAVRQPADAIRQNIVAPQDDPVGRIVWVAQDRTGLRLWATSTFDPDLSAWPQPSGPEMRFVERALDAVRDGRTHRSGAVLALANVSHIVTTRPGLLPGLHRQADLSARDAQGRVTVWANRAWGGPARAVETPPADVLTSGGLLELTGAQRGLPSAVEDGRIVVEVPATDDEQPADVVHLAVGSRRGWRIGEQAAEPAAAGITVAAPPQGRLTVVPPGDWRGLLRPFQLALLALVVAAWATAAYLAGPSRVAPEQIQLQARAPRRGLVLVPALLVIAAAAAAAVLPVQSARADISSAAYCMPVGTGPVQRLAVVNPGTAPVAYRVRESVLGAPTSTGEVQPGDRITLEANGETGAVVESFGNPLAVAAIVSNTDSADTASCDAVPEPTVYLAQGGRRVGVDRLPLGTTYVLHNPFPEVARVAVRFFTPEESIAPPAFQDLAVAPGTSLRIDPEDQLEPTDSLGAEFRVWKGRAFVARRLSRAGVIWWSLARPATQGGVLPRAATEGAATELVAINPGEAPTRIALGLIGEEGSFPSLTVEVSPRAREAIDVEEVAPDQVAVLVEVSADRPFAMESVVVPDGRRNASILPLVRPARDWVFPAAEGRALLLSNPGTRPVRVSASRLGPGPPISPVVVAPGGVEAVDLPGEASFGVRLRSSGGPVVPALIGGAGSYIGRPLPVSAGRT